MAQAGKETGHNSLPDFVHLKDGKPALKTESNLPEMIVHLADDMTFTPIVKAGEEAPTSFLTVEERMQAADFPNKYPFLYKEGFGFDATGKVVTVKDVKQPEEGVTHARTYAEWQGWVANGITAHLVSKIAPDVPSAKASQYLKQLVNQAL